MKTGTAINPIAGQAGFWHYGDVFWYTSSIQEIWQKIWQKSGDTTNMKPEDLINIWKTADKTTRFIIGGSGAVVVLLLLLLSGGGEKAPAPGMEIVQESTQNVILESVYQHGKIDEFAVKKIRPVNASDLPDGVFLITIQTHKDLANPALTNCILIKDEIGYKEAGYAAGMFDCDSFPEIRRPEDSIEISPLSTGDLMKEAGQGFYELYIPANVIPGYEHKIRCFVLSYAEGALGVFTGYGGMACEFGQKTQR